MKIKCVIVDDDPNAIGLVKSLCSDEKQLSIVDTFPNGDAFLAAAHHSDFDLVFLDVDMPGTNGIEVAKKLKNKLFIFISGYTERAFEAHDDVEPVKFLSKPISEEKFRKAIRKVKDILSDRPGFGHEFFVTKSGKIKIAFDDIHWITTDKSKVSHARNKAFFLKNGAVEEVLNMNFEELTSILPDRDFQMINKQDMIHLAAFKGFKGKGQDEILIIHPQSKSDQSLTLSDKFREIFMKKIGR